MSEDTTKSSAGKGLGIAGFVLGLLALIFSFVPCLGIYAMYPGIIALILAGVAFMQANKGNGPKGLIIAALIISAIGTGVAIYQYSFWNEQIENADEIGNAFKDAMEENMTDEEKEEMDNIFNELDEALEDLDEEMDEEEDGEEH